MPTVVRISDSLLKDARKYSKVEHRSLSGQIEHWARIGKCAEENRNLTYNLIKEIFIGVQEFKEEDNEEYRFG